MQISLCVVLSGALLTIASLAIGQEMFETVVSSDLAKTSIVLAPLGRKIVDGMGVHMLSGDGDAGER